MILNIEWFSIGETYYSRKAPRPAGRGYVFPSSVKFELLSRRAGIVYKRLVHTWHSQSSMETGQ